MYMQYYQWKEEGNWWQAKRLYDELLQDQETVSIKVYEALESVSSHCYCTQAQSYVVNGRSVLRKMAVAFKSFNSFVKIAKLWT